MDNKIKRVKKTDLSITVLLLIGIIIAVNFLSYQLFYRWDLTGTKSFSISDASKNTVGELDDIVSIKAYFSDTLPGQLVSVKQEVADILNEYQAYSNGNVKVEFIDPSSDPAIQQELNSLGVPQLTFEVYEKDKMQMVNGFMAIVVSFGGGNEVIPAVKKDAGDLEYQLTMAIKKVTTENMAKVGYLKSHGTRSLSDEMKSANQALSELYTIENVSLADEDPEIPDDINTLIVANPKEAFNDKQLEAINEYLSEGKALLVLMDGVSVGAGLATNKNASGLDKLLSKYGITMNKDIIADSQSGMASFTQGFFTFSSNYVFWPKLLRSGFNQENSAVSSLENVIFPWASSVNIDYAKVAEETGSYLAFTTPKAWHLTDSFNIAPNTPATPQGEQKQYNIIAFVNGEAPNAYPKDGGEDKIDVKIIAVGDSDFATDGFAGNNPDNLILFQNLVDILSFDEDLINIRSKGITSRPVEELTDGARAGIRYLNIFGLTVAVVAFGMIRYYSRRRSRFVDDI